MKKLWSWFLVLGVSVLGAVPSGWAQEESFYLAFASDPQLPWRCVTPECKERASSLKEEAILTNAWQTQSMNQFAEELGTSFEGVIVNGDLTAFGHNWQFKDYLESFVNLIQAPVYPGLGNHDYANNINDCWNNNCAARMVRYMNEYVKRAGSMILSYDFFELPTYYQFPSFHKNYVGSLSYSMRIRGVRFVQLHFHPSYETEFSTWNWSKARRDHFKILPSLSWLEMELVAAAKLNEAVIVSMHDFEDHMTMPQRNSLIRLFEKYKVEGVFYGHFHSLSGRRPIQSSVPYFISGSSSTNRYLIAEFRKGHLFQVRSVDSRFGNTQIVQEYNLQTDDEAL